MQEKMAELRAEIQRETGDVLKMRIGINRGECIVGNMGSASRFDYAAVGDPVNLASRLEGANKVYGTGILVSGAVADTVKDGTKFREIDTVRVKGKLIGITLYTPCDDERLVAMSAKALALYRDAKLDAAEHAFAEIVAAYPADTVAPIFLARLAALRKDGIPQLWDGVTALETK